MNFISLDTVVDEKSLENLIIRLRKIPFRLMKKNVGEDIKYSFLERLHRGDCGELSDTQLKILYEKLPKGYLIAEFNGTNPVSWAISNSRYVVLKEMMEILSQLYDKCLFSSVIPKEENFWKNVFEGSILSWTNGYFLSEIELLKKALSHAIERKDRYAISILLDDKKNIGVELRKYKIPIALSSRGGIQYAKVWSRSIHNEIDTHF